ncbi:reverse transcriptase-like protein [Sphingomonas desiccabilis]|nr:reverse transcriptase-like protein [Sphingomonas desiccabilis]MBB3911802.1 ribonuclease HI [Sphingomonas desiccabilis]
MKLFFDGGSRPSPIGMELAVVAGGRSYVQRGLGPGTSMDAEWLALIEAMQQARALGVTDAVLLGDAAAVIAQANGLVRCPPSCLGHFQRFQQLARPEGRTRIRYVKRSQNLAGIALAALHAR